MPTEALAGSLCRPTYEPIPYSWLGKQEWGVIITTYSRSLYGMPDTRQFVRTGIRTPDEADYLARAFNRAGSHALRPEEHYLPLFSKPLAELQKAAFPEAPAPEQPALDLTF